MRTQKLIFIGLLLLLGVNVHAQLLWKVSGNGLSKPSYLFGTHHLIEQSQIVGFDKVLATALTADAVVGEMDMEAPDMQSVLLKGGIMKDTTMKDLLSAADYSYADSVFKHLLGAGMGQLGRFKPMFLNTMYTVMMYIKESGLKGQPQAVDVVIQKQAKSKGKSVVGLETVQQQVDVLFNSMPLKRQAEALMEMIKNHQKNSVLLTKLNTAYLAGDLQTMEALNEGDDSSTPEEKKILIDNRNANWLKQLPELMSKQSCFVAVGCLHLTGEMGLLKQLKNAGYTVEPVAIQ